MVGYKVVEEFPFEYTGTIQSKYFNPGFYMIECMGAQGGEYSSSAARGGHGGYCQAYIELTTRTKLYIVVGGQGDFGLGRRVEGGYNGGGYTHPSSQGKGAGSGGGATHVAKTSGLLSTFTTTTKKKKLLAVAGGGGGAVAIGPGGHYNGGYSVGEYGSSGEHNRNYKVGSGGSQTEPGESGDLSYQIDHVPAGIGQGGGAKCNSTSTWYGGGGGSGYYGGGYGGTHGAGAGGSCYANPSLMTDISLGGFSWTGNGYVMISRLEPSTTITTSHDANIQSITISPSSYNVGDTVTLTATLKPGYALNTWSGDISGTSNPISFTITKNVTTIHATSKPTNVNYYVYHRCMKLDGSTYELSETETLTALTNSTQTPNVKTFRGFASPVPTSIIINGNGNSQVNYYYTRNKYNITVENGTSSKYQYFYEETGDLIFNQLAVGAARKFLRWIANPKLVIINPTQENAQFVMSDFDVAFTAETQFNRVNSNIYKNMFPYEPFDIKPLQNLIEITPAKYQEIYQKGHTLQRHIVVYKDGNEYKPAIASEENPVIPAGIIVDTRVDFFTLYERGPIYDVEGLDPSLLQESTILYLSDKEAGKLVSYTELENNVYIPVAIYTNNCILVNIQEGNVGFPLTPYEEYTPPEFEPYQQSDLDDIVGVIFNGTTT